MSLVNRLNKVLWKPLLHASVCQVALRRKGADLSDLVPAHVRAGGTAPGA